MITTLSATAVILLLISMLLDDMSHPCTSLYAFLSVGIWSRIISWLLISLCICILQPLVLYAIATLFEIPSFTNASFRDGFVP